MREKPRHNMAKQCSFESSYCWLENKTAKPVPSCTGMKLGCHLYGKTTDFSSI